MRDLLFISWKSHTDLYTAGKGSLHVFMCLCMFVNTSIQGGNMDENQTVAGARSLKYFSVNQQLCCELGLWCFLTASLSCFLPKQ